jgi:AraC-like DNA-binding protein
VIEVDPLLRALIDHVCRLDHLGADDAAAKRLAAVLIDRIGEGRQLPLFVPSLRSPVARRAAEALRSDPADTPRIRDLAAGLGVSGRTIERAFVADAAMTVGEWRQRARISRAIALLAGGREVKEVALEAGYESASAFVTAFKRIVGITPGKLRLTPAPRPARRPTSRSSAR